jgi:hypothetical protein
MSLKAGELKYMVAFTLAELKKYGWIERFGKDLLTAGLALQTFVSELARPDQGEVLPTPAGMARIRKAYDTHLRACKDAGVGLSPKHHLACHLVHRKSGIGSRHQPLRCVLEHRPGI